MAHQTSESLPVIADKGHIGEFSADRSRSVHHFSNKIGAHEVNPVIIRTTLVDGAVTAGNTLVRRKTAVAVTADVTMDQSTAALSIPLTDNGLLSFTGTAGAARTVTLPTRTHLTAGAFGDATLTKQPYVAWMFRVANRTTEDITIAAATLVSSAATGGAILREPAGAAVFVAATSGAAVTTAFSAVSCAAQATCSILVELDNTVAGSETLTYTIC